MYSIKQLGKRSRKPK